MLGDSTTLGLGPGFLKAVTDRCVACDVSSGSEYIQGRACSGGGFRG